MNVVNCFDADLESFWGRMQVAQEGETRIELGTAIFDYLEVVHHRQRRHSSICMLTPIEYEMLPGQQQPVP